MKGRAMTLALLVGLLYGIYVLLMTGCSSTPIYGEDAQAVFSACLRQNNPPGKVIYRDDTHPMVYCHRLAKRYDSLVRPKNL